MVNMSEQACSTMPDPIENTPELSNNVNGENGLNGASCDNSMNSEDVNNEDTDSQQTETNKCASPTGKTEKSEEHLSTKELTECTDELFEQGNSNNGLESNHSNSNDSYQDTGGDTQFMAVSESQGKEDTNTDQVDDGDSKMETFKIVTIEKHHSDEEADSVNSFSGSDMEPRADDTVSIDSDSEAGIDDDSHNSCELSKSNDVIILENESEKQNGKTDISSEVHIIGSDNDNDDCMIANENKLDKSDQKTEESNKSQNSPKKPKKKKANETIVELRRSSRAIKRKKYSDDIEQLDDGSDVEEVVMEDPLKRRSKPIIINNAKALVAMAAKHAKSNTKNKDQATVVIIDSPVKSKPHTPLGNKMTNSNFNQNIYQTIVSRGTSVTPVSSKNMNQLTQVTQTAPAILPTLTDDMFVVEAPSFIVPYVYEKPAKMPFKEFVDQLGKEIEEERVKEEQALLEKQKAEKEQRQRERQEKKERGEEVEESEAEPETPSVPTEPDDIKKKKAEKKEKRRRKKDDDDASWDGSSSDESDDTITDEESNTVVIKDKVDNLDEIKDFTAITPETSGKTNSYFDLFLGKFFMNIGVNLVQEYVQTDLLKQQNRKFQREKKSGHSTKERAISIALLTKNLEMSKKNNELFTFEQKKCEFCTFKTESALAMAHHMETPHMKNNLYRCNFCEFEIKTPHDILFHMESKHGLKGKLERALSVHQCANCPFEDHGKGKLARHLVACAKRFKPESNLAPPIDWEHPAKIAKLTRNRNSMTPYQVSQFGRNHVDNSFGKVAIPIASAPPPQAFRPRNRLAPRQNVMPMSMRPGGVLIRQGPTAHGSNFPTAKKMPPSLSITPVPRQTPPVPVQNANTVNAKGFVICEICDGYIKDLEQLRNHMQWIHKVKIHPKMIYNRPPLNCQKCQFRFFTDQGLERHLLGSHGLVTSSMQEAANKGKDAGRCPVCGRVYQWKLLGHVSRDHNLTLKPAHLSYKCTVCTATFSMYRQFENHVYSAHSVVAKKVIDKKTKANANEIAAKQVKINDEITITPQPAKVPAPKK